MIVCAGQPVDDTGRPTGERCGRRFTVNDYGAGLWVPNAGATEMAWQPYQRLSDEQVRERARAAGWSVAGPPMCPRCRKPDPAAARSLAPVTTRFIPSAAVVDWPRQVETVHLPEEPA